MLTTFNRAYLEGPIWRLDPKDDPEEETEDEDGYLSTPFTRWIEGTFEVRVSCPYCQTKLHSRDYYEEESEIVVRDDGSAPDLAFLRWCRYCGYWQWQSVYENRGMNGDAAMSVLEEFDHKVPEGAWSELTQHLRRNEELWCRLDPRGMERLVAQIFRANHSDAEVIHVGKPGDGGMDVLFVQSTGVRIPISVKRRENLRRVEGCEVVRNLLGTLVVEGTLNGIVASNANHFSVQAERITEKVRKCGYSIKLIDRGKLNQMLTPMLPRNPWQEFVVGFAPPELHEHFVPSLADFDPDQLEFFEGFRF